MRASPLPRHAKTTQHGAALMIMIVIMVVGVASILVGVLSFSALKNARQERSSAALVQAKDALIGYAVKVLVSSSDIACASSSNCPRPGDLPCPDTDNDGDAESSCGSADGSSGQNLRLGRLPWKTLGLPDLRDGSGERLWYAVSNNFKNNTRTTCNNSSLIGCLNSDTAGNITVYDSAGNIMNTANTSTGAVAVIIAPGEALQRQGSSSMQDRSSGGINTASNYLDIATVGGTTEDNANFVDGSATNGFMQGPVLDSTGRTLANDQLLVISESQIIPLLERRVAAEVKSCLIEYAALPQNRGPSPNQGYYPWATAVTFSGGQYVYNDTDRLEFGHIPDSLFFRTCTDTGGTSCNTTSQGGGMNNNWGTVCTLNNSNWWVNWKELVFYGLAHSLRPHNLTHDHVCPGDACLTVNPPSSANDKSFVVIVAGKKLGAQARSSVAEKNSLSNYLEGANPDGNPPFEQSPVSTTFNDIVVFK
jgi:type II secretory pathway pseudopilin PulG